MNPTRSAIAPRAGYAQPLARPLHNKGKSMIEVGEILAILAKKRPIFHSEADFQHAFAWEIHQKLPNAFVRLELPVQVKNEYLHIDVWIKNQDEVLAVELKYKTRGLSVEINGEHYRLKNRNYSRTGRLQIRQNGFAEQGHQFMKNIVTGALGGIDDSRQGGIRLSTPLGAEATHHFAMDDRRA